MKSAVEETITAGDVALLTILVTLERVTVTGLVTGASMTEMLGVRGIWCAGQTTARNSDFISMRRMTAARNLQTLYLMIGRILLRHK